MPSHIAKKYDQRTDGEETGRRPPLLDDIHHILLAESPVACADCGLTSPLLVLVAVEGLVVHQVGVVVLEDGGQRHGARLLPVLDGVGSGPVERHLVPGVGN